MIVGVASVPLKFLSYMIDFQEEPLTVLDYTAQICGSLEVHLIPCDSHGVEIDMAVDSPEDLVSVLFVTTFTEAVLGRVFVCCLLKAIIKC